jgi:hypothetical protein
MKPPTLSTLLVFMLLWDVGPLLAASWQPRSRAAPAAQEIFPLAIRYREQIRQISSFRGCLRYQRPVRPAALSAVGHAAAATASQPLTPDLFSRLMPLRC